MGPLKVVLVISVLGFSLGDAFRVRAPTFNEDLYACINTFSTVDLAINCYDVTKAESCLKKVVAVNDVDKERLESNIKYMQNERVECPGFKTMATCRAREAAKCNSGVLAKNVFEDKSVCNDTQAALACMRAALKESCTEQSIRKTIAFVENIDIQCKQGNIYGGDCSDTSIAKCTGDMFSKKYEVDAKGKHIYECSGKADAIKCLKNKKSNCKGDAWTEMGIDLSLGNIESFCRSV